MPSKFQLRFEQTVPAFVGQCAKFTEKEVYLLRVKDENGHAHSVVVIVSGISMPSSNPAEIHCVYIYSWEKYEPISSSLALQPWLITSLGE